MVEKEQLKLKFSEDWKEIPAEIPVTQDHVNHPDLVLGLNGPGKDSIKKSHHDKPADDPYYISRVSEVGFTDLKQGGGSTACSRLDWIEVYAYLVNSN